MFSDVLTIRDEFQKNIYFFFIDYAKVFDCVDHNKLWKILRDGNTRPPDLPLEKSVCRSGSKLELDMQQQPGSKQERTCNVLLYVKAVYCHPAYLTYNQRMSCEMPGWMKHKLESRLLGEISITSDMQMTPPYDRKQTRTKEPLDEEKSEKAHLKLNIQKTFEC